MPITAVTKDLDALTPTVVAALSAGVRRPLAAYPAPPPTSADAATPP